jgi:hypothetical protein
MSQFSYDVAATYRIYPKMSKNPPPIFQDDKFKLAELCFQSFKDSLRGLRVKLWVLLNDCPPAYEAMFTRIWGPDHIVLLRYPGVAAGTTLHEASRILREQTDAEIVYFADDDYVYLRDQFKLGVDFLKQNLDADFVAYYDHLDLHTTDLHNLPSEARDLGGKTWYSRGSTTHTFLATRAALIETHTLFSRLHKAFYGQVSPDLAMWMALTKKRVFNPVKFFSWVFTHPFWTASIFYAWFYCWRQILFGRRFTLWIPRPSLATHMEARALAPGIDWQKEFREQQSRIPEA